MTSIVEAEQTQEAREILVKALKSECFSVQEEKVIHCVNNMGEPKDFSADIYASINFIIELDPSSSHGGDHRSKIDKWRNENIYKQYGIRTIRLQPVDIIADKKTLVLTFKEMLSQLKAYSTE